MRYDKLKLVYRYPMNQSFSAKMNRIEKQICTDRCAMHRQYLGLLFRLRTGVNNNPVLVDIGRRCNNGVVRRLVPGNDNHGIVILSLVFSWDEHPIVRDIGFGNENPAEIAVLSLAGLVGLVGLVGLGRDNDPPFIDLSDSFVFLLRLFDGLFR